MVAFIKRYRNILYHELQTQGRAINTMLLFQRKHKSYSGSIKVIPEYFILITI